MALVQNRIVPSQAHYINREKLERLLQKLFRRRITVVEKNEVFVFDAPRLLTEDEIEEVSEDDRKAARDGGK